MKIINRRAEAVEQEQLESITDRQERIEGWRQDLLAAGRALVVGAGALGNEVVKNLSLMGLGYVMIADFDLVERSNLSRGILFRSDDVEQKLPKAKIVAQRAREIHVLPQAHLQPFHGDIVWQLGRGVFRRVDVVIGCLDNIEARMSVNAACLLTETPFIDGGILGLAGNVTAVHAPYTACWECTTTSRERENRRNRYDYSCSGIIKRDIASGRVPTVQVASTIIAGFQAQEAVKVIQGHPWAAGYMIQYHAAGQRPDLDVIRFPRRPGCWCNEARSYRDIVELPLSATKNRLKDLFQLLRDHGVKSPEVKLPGRFILGRYCTTCKRLDSIMKPAFTLNTDILFCPFCHEKKGKIELPFVEHTMLKELELRLAEFEQAEQGQFYREQMMELYLCDIGFPQLSLIEVFSNEFDNATDIFVELSGDALEVMGGEQYANVRPINS